MSMYYIISNIFFLIILSVLLFFAAIGFHYLFNNDK